MAEAYKNLKQYEVTKMNEDGDVVKYFRIVSMSLGGVRFTTDFPAADMTRDHVHEVLTKKAEELDAILEL